MSWHNHDTDEFNKRFSPKERREQNLVKALEGDIDKAKEAVNKEIQRDIEMLDRLKQFDLTEKDIKWIFHLAGLPNKQMLINYIQARTGSAILHYINRYVENLPIGDYNDK